MLKDTPAIHAGAGSILDSKSFVEERTAMATITVTTATDEAFDGTESVGMPDGTGLSLREAIGVAASDDTIDFDAALDGQTIALSTGELAIGKNLMVDGDRDDDGAPDITISGSDTSRIFNIQAGNTVTLDGLALVNGYHDTTNGGGAVLNFG
ncbi:MAG: hypothetical protein GVY13_00805, partial [Alphaproteobacteria bacterium]|nr:hypothetical protein [Alphaproteobacteria bacterium]